NTARSSRLLGCASGSSSARARPCRTSAPRSSASKPAEPPTPNVGRQRWPSVGPSWPGCASSSTGPRRPANTAASNRPASGSPSVAPPRSSTSDSTPPGPARSLAAAIRRPMADIDTYLSSSIDDYLLSIAEGIRLAQGRLDQLQSNAGSTWSYYLPKLEFELKMTVEMVENKQLSAKLGSERLRPLADRHLMLRPINPTPSTQSQITVEAASVIRGTFVAVPANAGRP